jgi:hypothetical protein
MFGLFGDARASTTSFSAEISTAIEGDIVSEWRFNTTGDLCPTGKVTAFTVDREVLHPWGQGAAFQPSDPHWNQHAWFNAPQGVYSGTQTLTCDDGSGSITLYWFGPGSLRQDWDGVTGRFTVASGTGAYATLEGHGAAHVRVLSWFVTDFDGVFSYR